MPNDEKQRIRDEESAWKNRKEEEGGGDAGEALEPDWFEDDLDELEDDEEDDDDE